MTFQIDTSGYVDVVQLGNFKLPGRLHYQSTVSWDDLLPFAQGYVEALFAGVWDRPEFRAKWMLRDVLSGAPEAEWDNSRPAFSDLAPETLARIIADCEAMDVLRPGVSADGDRSAGRGWFELRQSGAYADRFPPLTVQLGDDGKVRFADA